jgi:hypothetical protein
MPEAIKTTTTDEFVAGILSSAWVGLKERRAADPDRMERACDYYVERLRNAKTLDDVRGLIAELCAEGGPVAALKDKGVLTLFWQYLERDFRKCRDIALLTSAA